MSLVKKLADRWTVMTGGLFTFVLGLDAPVALEATPATILATYIINELALATDPGDGAAWPMYVSSMPDGSDVENDCGCCYDTTGVKQFRLMNGIHQEKFGIQLRIRSVAYTDGFAKAESIATSLDAVNRASVVYEGETYTLVSVNRQGPVTPLGVEREGTERRDLFTVNFLVKMLRVA
jgi:hypothetical protein